MKIFYSLDKISCWGLIYFYGFFWVHLQNVVRAFPFKFIMERNRMRCLFYYWLWTCILLSWICTESPVSLHVLVGFVFAWVTWQICGLSLQVSPCLHFSIAEYFFFFLLITHLIWIHSYKMSTSVCISDINAKFAIILL